MTNRPPKLRLPYAGLRPFLESDHRVFFGREEQLNELLRKIEDAGFVAVIGSSGCGKSSLVRAGLIPLIRDGYLFGTPDWEVAIVRPGHKPYEQLSEQLVRVFRKLNYSDTLKALRRSDRALLDILHKSIASKRKKRSLFVVIDQFEELFGFRHVSIKEVRDEDEHSSVASRDEAASFVAMLMKTAESADDSIRLISTMRSDFMGDCDVFLGFPELVSSSQFLVPRLTREQMERAIEMPGRVKTEKFKPFDFEDGLVTRLVNDAGDRPDQLPLLQHVLMRSWKLSDGSQISHRDYAMSGKIAKALSDDADEAWAELAEVEQDSWPYLRNTEDDRDEPFATVEDADEETTSNGGTKADPPKTKWDVSEESSALAFESAAKAAAVSTALQRVARHLFVLLCDVTIDGQYIRRRPLVREVMSVADATQEQVGRVVSIFKANDRNFLVAPDEIEPDTLLDISHESLLRQWGNFEQWLREEKRSIVTYEHTREDAREWLLTRDRELLWYDDRKLTEGLEWLDVHNPAWADRYGGDYEACKMFLQESLSASVSRTSGATDGSTWSGAETVIDSGFDPGSANRGGIGFSPSHTTRMQPPPSRRLRGYAFDPSLSSALSTMQINELTYKVSWEHLSPRKEGESATYPMGEYLEIVDYDPASGKFYQPVNLDDPYLLAQDGLPPSVSNPQFHQQMVYAVMMTTIKNFERALGRKIQWAENIRFPKSSATNGVSRPVVKFEFVSRLRVYPHALRQANAFYDPNKKAILFGYFSAKPADPQLQLPGSTTFTCLSHDIIAHETTHAILDGFHRRYIDATHPDTRAFHEAFADIVALFQHFSFSDVLKHQIAATRGDLKQKNILGQLAQQFGKATGGYGALRDAIGGHDDEGNWKPHVPDANQYKTEMRFHSRGGILVAAVFDAFISINEHRIQRVMRIATGGTGVLPEGEIHPDLVSQIAESTSKTAADVLRICVRALDYCPPMDITFGDYLRALITADYDMMADDERGYRVAFVEAFQRRGISVAGIKSMAIEELMHEVNPNRLSPELEVKVAVFLRELKEKIGYLTNREEIYHQTKALIRGEYGLHRMIEQKLVSPEFSELTGLMFPGGVEETEEQGLEFAYLTSKSASYAVGNVWLANRITPKGDIVNHAIVTLIQKRGVRCVKRFGDEIVVDENGFFVPDKTPRDRWGRNHIIFRGGCTLIFDLDQMRLRYAIKKDIDDRARMIRQYKYQNGMMQEAGDTYFDSDTMASLAGPFAFMHSHTHEH